MPQSSGTRQRVRARRVVGPAVVIAIVAVLGACDGDGSLSDVTLPGGSQPAATAPEGGDGTQPPEATQPPPEETSPPEQTDPPAEQTPATSVPEDDSGLSDESITLLVLLGLGLLIVAGVAIWMSSRRRSNAAAVVQPGRLSDVMGRARWLHDQASMEILRITDPAQLAQSWQATSASVVELEGWEAGLVAAASDPTTAQALQNLQTATAGVRGALQSDVALRSNPAMADRRDLVQASVQTVQQRRGDLDVALADPLLRSQ